MANKQNLSVTKKKSNEIKDLCPVCDKSLYFNADVSKRVGLLGDNDEVIGWLCPYCRTEFDFNEKVVNIMGGEEIRGEA